MLLPLSECSRLTGTSRSGLLKAIKRGSLSASRDESSNQWLVDAAELSRVYKMLPRTDDSYDAGNDVLVQSKTMSDSLRTEIKHLKEIIEVIKDERNNLRTRLEAESEERRRLTLIITSDKAVSEKTKKSKARIMFYVISFLCMFSIFVVMVINILRL